MKINNNEIGQRFKNNIGDADGSNMFIEGDAVYSYGYHFKIVQRVNTDKGDFYLFTNDGYSNTTERHKSMVLSSLSHNKVIFIDSHSREFNEQDIKAQQEANAQELAELKAKQEKRTSKPRTARIQHLEAQQKEILNFFTTTKGKEILNELV